MLPTFGQKPTIKTEPTPSAPIQYASFNNHAKTQGSPRKQPDNQVPRNQKKDKINNNLKTTFFWPRWKSLFLNKYADHWYRLRKYSWFSLVSALLLPLLQEGGFSFVFLFLLSITRSLAHNFSSTVTSHFRHFQRFMSTLLAVCGSPA